MGGLSYKWKYFRFYEDFPLFYFYVLCKLNYHHFIVQHLSIQIYKKWKVVKNNLMSRRVAFPIEGSLISIRVLVLVFDAMKFMNLFKVYFLYSKAFLIIVILSHI